MAARYLLAEPSLERLKHEILVLETELRSDTPICIPQQDTLNHTLEWIDTQLQTHYQLVIHSPLHGDLELICIRPDFDVYVESVEFSENESLKPLASLTQEFLENKKLSRETSGVYKCLGGARSFSFKVQCTLACYLRR